MLDVTEQLHRYGDAVTERVEPVSAADATAVMTEPRPPRHRVWQPLAAAAAVLVVIASGVWLADRSPESSPPSRGLATGGDQIEVGVATVVIPDGMTLEQLEDVELPDDPTPQVTRSDGSVASDPIEKSVRARLSTPVGMCTITSYRGHVEVERFNAELQRFARLQVDLRERVAALDQRIASLPPGSGDVAPLASQRDAALEQLDRVGQEAAAVAQAGPQRVPAGAGFMPTDASRTRWRAQATPTGAVQIACPDQATAQRVLDATTLPAP